ncbi:hypothetical protein [Niallia sp.]|uniref:hypothetical protein n=1 Tax=Niallia sp. TaxID=2837523 RepID=UPI0028985D15|nr:hypothetical protein [Niallia sp.]
MKFHDDKRKAFKPLFDHLKDEYMNQNITTEDFRNTVDQYMYMYHDEDSTYYKHFGSREYFNIDREGNTKGQLEDWKKW